MQDVVGFAGLGAGAFAFLCALIAAPLNYWSESQNGDTHSGLWIYCNKLLTPECDDVIELLELTNSDDQITAIKAVRAMVIMGILTVVGGIVALALLLFVMKDKKILGFISGGVFLVGGLFLMIGMAIWADEFIDDDDTDGHAGFALCILGWLSAWVAGGLAIFAAISSSNDVQTVPDPK